MIKLTRALNRSGALAATILLVGACNKGGGTGPGAPTPTTVVVSPATPQIDAIGATVQLAVTVLDQTGQAIAGPTVTWSSGGTGVASVDANGLVTAAANGSEVITATSGSVSGSVTVTVQQVPAMFAKVAGDAQGPVTVGAQLADDLVAEIQDSQGNALEGIALEFRVTQGGGSLTTTTVTSDASGQATTTWTLGTTSGQQEVDVEVVSNTSVVATFTAQSDPDTPTGVAIASGDAQSGLINQALTDPIVAKVVDQYGNGVPGVDVEFTVVSGGGAVSPTAPITTDGNGDASATWTLGSFKGTQEAQAQDQAQTLAAVMFTATGGELTLTSASPDPIVEGATATLTGTDFDLTPGNNQVTVDGVPATVTSVAPDRMSMQITVPTFDCKPLRTVDISVQIGAFQTPPLSHDLEPDEPQVNLGVGQFTLIQDPASFCLQFDAQTGTPEYLIGVQSTGELASAVTPVVFNTLKDPAAPFVMQTLSTQTASGGFGRFTQSDRDRRLDAHRALEGDIYEKSRLLYERMRGVRPQANFQGAVGAALVPNWATKSEGDTVHIRVPDVTGNLCTNYAEVVTTVRKIGTNAIWLSDDGNDQTDPFTDQDFTDLASEFDADIHPPDVAVLGNPEDTDSNNATVIVFTKEVNKVAGLLGFVTSGDLIPRTSCPASNQGEFFYEKAPEGTSYSAAAARADAPFVIAHEYAHVIQQGRRDKLNAPFLDSWLAEGQATLAEEVVGHSVENRTIPVTNLGVDEALNDNQPSSIDWYSNGFVDIGRYFGFDGSNPKVANAPWECGWLSRTPGGPCTGQRKVYGVPWSLLRFIADQYRGTYPGGEAKMQQDLIDMSASGYQVLRNLLSNAGAPSLETVLAHWAMMLYVDGRVGSAANEITLQSWDMFDVYHGTTSGSSQSFNANLRLQPQAVGYADNNFTVNVRDGSSFYGLLNGATNPPAFALDAEDLAGNDLPSKMQMFIVRTN